MFKTRTEPVPYGLEPYKWGIDSVYQCVWYVYYRCLECGFSPVEWWNRETKEGSYYHAKTWLKNYRDPWQVKGTDYVPVAGDVAVYDYGEYGHVQFMETDTMYAEYSNGDPNSFRNGIFEKKSNLLGFLHYPYEPVHTVDRNESVDQIQCNDELLRIRTEPNLNGQIVGHVQKGYYNVLKQAENDGYTWFEIEKDRWCANVDVVYLPSQNNDFVKEIERWANEMVAQVKQKDETISKLKGDMAEIQNISRKWE